jgi:hypothetical protein
VRASAILTFGAAITASACGGSPVSPDPRIPPATGTPDTLTLIDWQFGPTGTTSRAQATWGYLYSTTRDVTTESVWESRDSAVVAIAAPGRMVSRVAGDANVRVTFRGAVVSRHLRVFTGEPPLLVLEPSDTTYVSGAVRDPTAPAIANGVEGVTVSIIAGHNQGRSAVTERGGFYYFYPPFVCGPITMHATKAGYRDSVGSSVMCMNGLPSLPMTHE